MTRKVAIAVGAHPDDIEFSMAGTLLLLARAGYETHYWHLGSGSCGSRVYSAARLKAIRRAEAREAARILGAEYHGSLADDLEILYDLRLLRRVAAVLREVNPGIILTHSPQDYMEDHTATARLVVTGAFALGMPNFRTSPPRRAVEADVAIYHAMPHGLCDPLRKRIVAEAWVDTEEVFETKLAALAAHKSQQDWLETSQGMNSYLETARNMSLEVGRQSGRFRHAEGWRRRLHLGFSLEEKDPLRDALGERCLLNPAYEEAIGGRTTSPKTTLLEERTFPCPED